MGAPRDFYEAVRGMILRETRWLRSYYGEITSVEDPLSRGRVQVKVEDLGWDRQDIQPWCWPRDKAGLVVPSVGQWVEVWFALGEPSKPSYRGIAAEVQGMTPSKYTGPTLRVLWQDADTDDYATYDSEEKKLEVSLNGNTVTVSDDGILVKDKNGNTITMDDSGILVEDANGNTVTMEAGKVTINGNLEVLQ